MIGGISKLEQDMISVIVPVYNTEKYLSDCIDSLLKQTYQNLELILVDDGSTDHSGRICDEYSLKDERIKVIHKKNEGVSSARNLGLQNCNGKYIAFVDSDDFVTKNYLELLCQNLLNYKADISICNSSFTRYKCKSGIVVCDNQLNHCKYTFLYYTWGKLFSKQLLENVYFDTDLTIGEDSYFIAQLLKRSKYIYYDSTIAYIYRQNPTSLTHTDNSAYWNTALLAWDRISQLYEEGSIAYWSAKLTYMKRFRQIVNVDRKVIGRYQKEFQKNKKSIFFVRESLKEKILILFLAYFPNMYFKVYQIFKRS